LDISNNTSLNLLGIDFMPSKVIVNESGTTLV